LALRTPFGTLVTPNITPDPETGIGDWTKDEFVAAMHDGRGHNGKRLYPAMPYPAYTKMSDDDVLAIRAYLGTVAPVRNEVNPNRLPFPFNIRLAMVFWNALNFTPGRYQPNPQKSSEWNRGAYLVEGAAHCGTCHTPKTMLGGDKTDRPLEGATLQGWFAPISPATRTRASAHGRRMNWFSISRPARTSGRWPPGRWPRRSPIRRQR
jgi:mono/diheme cytochrome c family protein